MAELPYINDKENNDWLRQLKLKGKSFDRVAIVSIRDTVLAVYFEKNKWVGAIGDKFLKEQLEVVFTTPFETLTGDIKETKGETIYSTVLKTYKPGDEGYVNAVLLDRVQREMGMVVE